jgi:hypothetical protein
MQLVYLQTPALHDAPTLCVESHASPHPPQFDGVVIDVSHPSVSRPDVLQSLYPDAQLVYVHLPLEHPAPVLVVVSHFTPHAVQFVIVLSGVSHPFALLPDVSQSPKPETHPVYTHFPPTHAAPRLVAVSHLTPHPPQLSTVLSSDSHPSVSGGVLLQSP